MVKPKFNPSGQLLARLIYAPMKALTDTIQRSWPLITIFLAIFCNNVEAKIEGEVCSVSTQDCGGNLFCTPTNYRKPPQTKPHFGGFSETGVCAKPALLGQYCAQYIPSKSCSAGLACIPQNASDSQSMRGICKPILQANQEELLLLSLPAPPLNCEYLPGNYINVGFNSNEGTDRCCGRSRPIAKPGATGGNLTNLSFCDYARPPDTKNVFVTNFCGPNEQTGMYSLWEGNFANAATTPENRKCVEPLPYDPTIYTHDPPSFGQINQQCEAKFSDTDLASYQGLASDWTGEGYLRWWFISFPGEHHYKLGDEAFILSYIWLLKNTDNDSRHGGNFAMRDLSQKLHTIFNNGVSQGYRDSFTLMKKLDQIKQCIDQQKPIAFQLRYAFNAIMIEKLRKTVLAYQCGEWDKMNTENTGCAADFDQYFSVAMVRINSKLEIEHGDCSYTFGGGCQRQGSNLGIELNWGDSNRHQWINRAASRDFNVSNTGINNVGIDWLIDPPWKNDWVQPKLKENKLAEAITAASAGGGAGQIVFPSGDGKEPNFNWRLILKPEKYAEAFPVDSAFNSPAFLHFHERMPFNNQGEQTQFLMSRKNPDVDETTTWSGTHTVAGEAVRIMELISMADEDLTNKNRQVRIHFFRNNFRQRLSRLMAYYEAKADAMEIENICLEAQIRSLMAGLGTPLAADANVLDIALQNTAESNPACAGAIASSGSPNRNGSAPVSGSVAAATGLKTTGASLSGSGTSINNQNNNQNLTFVGIEGGSANPSGKGTQNNISLMSLSGSNNSLNNTGLGALASANKKNRKDQRQQSLLFKEKQKKDLPKHVERLEEELVAGMMAGKRIQVPQGKPVGNSSSLANLVSKLSDKSEAGGTPSLEENSSGANSVVMGKLGDEKLTLTGNVPSIRVEQKTASAANQVSHTGLDEETENNILQGIQERELVTSEDDTLWQKITKTYIKSYTKLFRPKSRR